MNSKFRDIFFDSMAELNQQCTFEESNALLKLWLIMEKKLRTREMPHLNLHPTVPGLEKWRDDWRGACVKPTELEPT